MAVIVGDKLKLSNYSYLLQRDGKGFVGELQNPERRDRQEKLIDAIDIDWRPFRFKNFSYVSTSDKATYTDVTEAGDLFDTERLIDWISYSYSMGKNLDFYGYVFHNRQTNLTIDFARPTMLTNIGWVDKDSRIIGYTFWPAVGSINKIKTLDKTGCDNVFINTTGEIFNDYANNEAPGTYAHAEGYETHGTGNSSHAEGCGTFASGNYSHAEGGQTHAVGEYSHAGGRDSFANGKYSFVHGDEAKAEGMYSVAFGMKTIASGGRSFVEGGGFRTIDGTPRYTVAAGSASHAEGTATYAGGDNSHAEGNYTYATGNYSHSEGFETKASGESSHAEGKSTTASGIDSHAEGESTTSSGKDSHSEGVSTVASGDYSHAEGSASQSIGLASHAEGQLSEARGAASHTEGFQTLSIGDYSHAEGESTEATGKDSHAEGYNNVTTANYSHIEGSSNRMNQFSTISHVEGVSNEVNNSNITHVEGESNIVNDSDNSHIGGYGNQITGTSSSIIFGSDNTTTSSTNITVFGKDNEVTAKRSSVIGTLSKINSSSEYSQVFGTNSYSTKSYITIVGNNTYSSGSYSILIGDNIGTSKENSTLLGTYISVGNNSSVPVSIGRNIFSDYESPLSIGINITNNGRSGSTAIGYGLLLNNVNGKKFVTGKFNEALPVGYQFALGDGQSNTQRHNAFITTDNNWTYVTALATYINNITTTEQNVAITYETNFVHIKSFNEIKRGVEGKGGLENKDTNTYNLNFNTYILPTKRYVDKLLAAKDVFRFAGTFTPTDTTWTTDPKDHTVRGSWKPSVTPSTDVDNDQQYSYSYTNEDFSAGAVWKVTSTGWFGSTYVMGGDLVISYDDAAKNNNDAGWAVIDTQIAFMENYGTYSTYKGNGALLNDPDLRNFFITNINLSDTGYLTYSYAGILTEYRTDSSSTNARGLITKSGNDRNPKFLSNISLIRHNNRIELAYTYTDFYSCYTTPEEPQYTDIDVMENANLQFVYDVYLSNDGILSYSKYTMKGFKHHHHISGAYNWSYAYLSYDTGDDLTYIVSNIHFTNDGHLSYTYTVLSNLRNHHRTRTYTFPDFDNDTRTNESLRVLTNVNLDSNGNLTYTGYNVINLKHHHHTLAYIHNGDTVGRNSYNYERDIDVSGSKFDTSDDADNSNRKIQFLTYAYLSSDGDLSAYYATISNIRRHHHTLPEKHNGDTGGRNNNDEGDFNAYSSTATSDVHKVLSYAWINPYGYLTAYYYTLTNLSAHHATGSSQGNDLTAYSWDKSYTKVSDNLNSITDGIKFVDGLYLNKNGKLSYHYTYIGHLRHHHSYEGKESTTYDVGEFDKNGNDDFGFISGVSMTTDGRLTYTTSSISNLKSHHGTTHDFGYAYDVFTSNSEGCNSFGFISHVNLDANGHFTYKVSSITDLRNHHSDGFPAPSTNAKGNNFVTDVSLSENGYLTGTFGSFGYSGTHDTAGDKNFSAGAEQNINVVTGIKIDGSGQISYSYSEVKNTRNHHATSTPTNGESTLISKPWEKNLTYIAGAAQHDNAYTDFIKYIDGVNLSTAGTLTYHWTYINHLRSHHRGAYTAIPNEDAIDKLGQNDYFAFIDSVSLSPEGELTATSKTVEIPDKVNHADSTGKFDHTLTIKHGANGEDTNVLTNWDGSSNATVDLNNHGTATVSSTSKTLDFSDKFYVVTGVTLDKTGYLQPSMTTYTLPTRAHHSAETTADGRSFTINNLKNTDANNFINVVTNVGTTEDGHITATTVKLIDKLNHHGGSVATKGATEDPGFSNSFTVVKSVSLSENGQLSGTYQEVKMPTQDHHTGSITGGHFIVTASMLPNGTLTGTTGSFSTTKSQVETGFTINTNSAANYIDVIVGIDINSTGKITYNYRRINDNLYHHSQNSTTTGNFVNGVSLSTGGALTRSYGNFTNSHNHTDTVATRTSKATHGPRDGAVTIMTYNYIDTTGKITNRYETIELRNSQITLVENPTDAPSSTTIIKGVSLEITTTDVNHGDKQLTHKIYRDDIWESNVS